MRWFSALVCVLVALPASAQVHVVRPAAPRGLTAPAIARRQDVPVSPAFLASAVLPGAAQFLAGDDRWVPYVAMETWGWLSYGQQRRAASRAERRYRDLAWQVARRVGADREQRRDSVFTYYEAMVHHAASGLYDVDPGLTGIQPEPDTVTFNGKVWFLARELNSSFGAEPGTPAYLAALQYYTAHAIPATYAWAWGESHLEQQAFSGLIEESDQAFRSATLYLGLLLANHITSAVDALVTARLRAMGADGLRMETVPIRQGAAVRWEYGVRYVF
jgi:hypothetical protein